MELGFYKESIVELEAVITEIIARLDVIRKYKKINNYRDPIEYIKTRIKSEDSMKEKLKRKNLEINIENALTKIYDAAGIRIICSFPDDVYDIAQLIKKYDDIEVIKEKDYIKNPKENGYRSYHLVVRIPINIAGEIHKVHLEIQIRTIAMDFWSSLEHQMKYKKNIKDQQMIVEELKKCAEQIATTDINMMAIRNMINRA
ncbi:MAG: GTP pyrophosphokinase family protein [Clostridia bacterium]|nr:GTP pyrophosphokinase family protein [Clostridia bacterium]